ncbi:MAG: pyridoxal-phosphate dependent enzyme [Acidobacteriota bacterium]
MPLFRDFPQLRKLLPHVSLATLPTPVERLERVGASIGLNRLYIKRDDLSGAIYGGNKVRKLEFLLADALGTNAKEVITFGFAGSNHALATAIYARQVGLKCSSLLMSQVNAHYVRLNLLAGFYYKARLCHYRNISLLLLGILSQLFRGRLETGVFPRRIPAGGSCPLGIIGYVNAAMELRDQVRAGELPEPDLLYVPLGSMGTAAGLMLGLRSIGFKTVVIPVRVIEERMARPKRMISLIRKTESFLRTLDPTFPHVNLSRSDLFIRNDCLGDGYACFTEKAVRAARLMKREEGIVLNCTYSAKAFSALLDDAVRAELVGKTVLFWNTYNSRDLSKVTSGIDFRQLPKEFHRYFEKGVQPLDTGEGLAGTNELK